MFSDNENLNKDIKKSDKFGLMDVILREYHYSTMFSGCQSVSNVPNFPYVKFSDDIKQDILNK